jgi:hypothetical protein
LWLVGNKVRNEEEADFIRKESPSLPVLGLLSANMGVQEADRLGIAVYDHVAELRQSAEEIAKDLQRNVIGATIE